MKGIIVAGGLATRLRPLTIVTNKHLLPVYNKPVIYYPLETLASIGLKEILIISGREHAGQFLNLLGSGREFGVQLSYEVQEEPKGIAQAVGLADKFADNGKIVAILGDNIYENVTQIKKAVQDFENQTEGAKIMLKEVPDPERFGVAEIKNGKVLGIEEKPKHPKSNLAVTGIYMYDASCFEIIRGLKPSARGELEITDVNNAYINAGTMTYEIVDGEWIDAGTFDSLLRAGNLMAKRASSA